MNNNNNNCNSSHRAEKYNQSITNLSEMIDDEQTDQLHHAW